MATLVLSSTLSEYAKNQSRVEIPGKTLFALLINLIQTFPHLRMHLFDIRGDLTKNMNFYLNEESVTAKYWQNIPVRKDDVVSILLASRSGRMPLESDREIERMTRPPRNERRDRLRIVHSEKVHE